jgi:hypothetical protein
MNEKFNFVFCKYAHGKNKNYIKCANCKKDMCPSVSNILYGKVFKLPVIKQIYKLISNIYYDIETKRYEKDYINEYEIGDMKHIWGLKSYDDLSSSSGANIHTMNDIELLYHKDTEDYSISIETIYMFELKDGDIKYLKCLLDNFTKWMDEHGYRTDSRVNLYEVFTYGNNINTHFKTIEECYANFKMLVNGYCSL